MTAFNFNHIPRGTGAEAAGGDQIVLIGAEFANWQTTEGGVRPGNIAAFWGIALPDSIQMETMFVGEVVYDGRALHPDIDFPDRHAPYHANFRREDPGVAGRRLPGGDFVVAQALEMDPPLLEVTALDAPLPVQLTGYHRFTTLAAAGERGAEAIDPTEAAAILGALARTLVPTEDDAAWALQKLMPPGMAPAV